jgi:hypothetical protein
VTSAISQSSFDWFVWQPLTYPAALTAKYTCER